MSQVPPAKAAFRMTVERVIDETPTVKTFRLRFPPAGGFDFMPGQFVMAHIPDHPQPGRAYSIASSPFDRGAIELTLNKVGDFTGRLFTLKAGDPLFIEGPYGKWHYRDEARHAVLISGGTAISPFRSIFRYVRDKGLENHLTILYSARRPAEIVYHEELREVARRPRTKVFVTMTRPESFAAGETWRGPVGRLDVGVIRREAAGFDAADFWLCGSNAMVSDLKSQLLEAGVPRGRIFSEKWGEF